MSDIKQEASVLVALLIERYGPLYAVDMGSISQADKDFGVTTCCAQLIAEYVWLIANYKGEPLAAQERVAHAFAGVDRLVDGIKANIRKRGLRAAAH